MGWDDYVKNLEGQGFKYGIIGGKGAIWAQSASLSATNAQLGSVENGFSNNDAVRSSGVTFGSVKYLVLRADENSIYGKKGAGGFVAVKTEQSVIIGIYDETLQPGAAAVAVAKLGDYLRSTGY
eukprot:TRINITY_DN9826_c0_g1_i1.p1 TRINITY_DN9826_c0_g1~~TRINITY_DN9826_c0_g1_i1.p1  ORF type:complete len:124 (-),score=32.69 TRINITY_DN9826_c0_g1_i1:7-378(-)